MMPPDRRHDSSSQPLSRLGPNGMLKDRSDQLRGMVAAGGPGEELTAAVPGDDVKLMKFHGLYQQDDRDVRDGRRRRNRQHLQPIAARSASRCSILPTSACGRCGAPTNGSS